MGNARRFCPEKRFTATSTKSTAGEALAAARHAIIPRRARILSHFAAGLYTHGALARTAAVHVVHAFGRQIRFANTNLALRTSVQAARHGRARFAFRRVIDDIRGA